MDELEIAGKQYISTRRAGREHGYHSDYIGQLIRGKKVEGQKVGRSWYVDAASLATYLGKEVVVSTKPAEIVSRPVVAEEPIATTLKETAEEVVAIQKEEPVVIAEPVAPVAVVKPEPELVQEIVVEKEIASTTVKTDEERVVPLHTPARAALEEKKEISTQPTGLVYVHDDAPSLPQVRTALSDAYAATPMAHAAVAFAPQNTFSYAKGAVLASLLGLALLLGVGAAAYVSSNLKVVDQTAISYYGIQK